MHNTKDTIRFYNSTLQPLTPSAREAAMTTKKTTDVQEHIEYPLMSFEHSLNTL